MSILDPNLQRTDAQVSMAGLDLLRSQLEDPRRSLVFFVGAGASIAGNTGMPSTPTLLYQLFSESLGYSGAFEKEIEAYRMILQRAGSRLGFEITLNDFWQICPDGTTGLYSAFSQLEEQCLPNRVHTFLASWLAGGGTVITTNYDRLIERQWAGLSGTVSSRYRSFETWQEDLARGGCLFKIHGSLDEPASCLGALEHVGTRLAGERADLLTTVLRTRPLCFVGWRGVDPDIPPVLHAALQEQDPSLPVLWIHYEGRPPGTPGLEKILDGMSELIRPVAAQNPILTEADRSFGEMLEWLGVEAHPNPFKEPLSFDFQQPVRQGTRSGAARLVGIALRRAGEPEAAERVLQAAVSLAGTDAERSSAYEELSLLFQQIGGRNTDRSRSYLARARRALGKRPDPWKQANTDFGLLSQSVVALKNRPWLLLKLPSLFRRYRRDIQRLRLETSNPQGIALHEALYWLYLGRIRFKTLGWAARLLLWLSTWIRTPFDLARSMIDNAGDINIHAHIDVLAYRAVALAHLGFCPEASEDIPEVDRLIDILNDDARTRHWVTQRREIVARCIDRGQA